MDYEFALTVPANTLATAPVLTNLHLQAGIVTYVEIEFPAGCAATDGSGNLARLQLWWEGANWIPTNPDGFKASDDHVIPVPEHLVLDAGNNVVQARAWNLDDTYDHTITLRIVVLPREVVEPVSPLVDLMRKFFRLVGVR